MNEYLTVREPVSAETEIKKSLFLTYLYPIDSEESAQQYLDALRKEHYKATHHCYAYSVGIETAAVKCSDDGEPSGTAGKPILSVIEHRQLRNIMIVVIRYFGGIKLGTGGLTRAYSQCASEAVAKAMQIRKVLCNRVEFITDYSFYGKLHPYLMEQGCLIDKQDFLSDITLEVLIPKTNCDSVMNEVINLSNGICVGKKYGETFTEMRKDED